LLEGGGQSLSDSDMVINQQDAHYVMRLIEATFFFAYEVAGCVTGFFGPLDALYSGSGVKLSTATSLTKNMTGKTREVKGTRV
jgi:hypothetical protein